MKHPRNPECVLVAAIALGLGATCASAATIAVGSLDDAFHSTTCNLRNAIKSFRIGAVQGACTASGNFGDNDTVTFAPALANSTITLASGQITIAGTVTIVGSGQTIDAGYASRVMYVNNATLTASGLTLTRGYAGGTGRDSSGGGLYVYGGTATLNDVTISHNYAIGDGGGINTMYGTLTLSHATVSGNTAANGHGGMSLLGNTTILDSRVVANSGTHTGGMAVFSSYNGYSTISSSLAISRSTIADNHAACSASPCTGGIYAGFGNFVVIGESTISGNSATGAVANLAGGLFVDDSNLNMVDSTIADNAAAGLALNDPAATSFVAGGMWQSGTVYGVSSVVGATISGNSATSDNAISYMRSGALIGNGGDSNLRLFDSIVAGNAGGADIGVTGSSEVVSACVLATSANLSPFNGDPTNRFSDTPGLGSLRDNGGPTQTMALQTGSVAIDAGKNAYASTAYDQRGPGFARVFDGVVDIGAVEYQGDRLFANGFEPGP